MTEERRNWMSEKTRQGWKKVRLKVAKKTSENFRKLGI